MKAAYNLDGEYYTDIFRRRTDWAKGHNVPKVMAY